MNYNVSFKRMYPEDFAEISGRMPHDSFIGSGERTHYEKIVKNHPLNKPKADVLIKENTQKIKESVTKVAKPKSTYKSFFQKLKNLL